MRKILNLYIENFIWILIAILSLVFVKNISDLPLGVTSWIPKAQEIASGKIPSSNFYPAGSSLMILPFILLKIDLFYATYVTYATYVVKVDWPK